MPLDAVARRYAETLFVEECEKLAREHATRSAAARADLAKRGSHQSAGPYTAGLGRTGVQHMEAVALARADTLLAAYARAGLPVDDQAVEEIFAEVSQLCETQGRNLADNIRATALRTGVDGQVETALSQEIAREATRVAAQVRRKLIAKRDEAILVARRAPAAEETEESDDLLPLLAKRQFERDLSSLVVTSGASIPFSLLFVDLDHFKRVNDSYGHPVGDEVLIETAKALRAVCAGKGRCYRWGGEELAVLLQNYVSSEAVALAERIREAIAQLKFTAYPDRMTASIGVASFPETSATLDGLVSDADQAMYAAKQAGRNQVCMAKGAAGVAAAGPEGAPRLSGAEIAKKVEAARIGVSIEQGLAQWFLINVQNDSEDEVTIKEVRLLSRDDIRLTEPARPESENLWRIPPRQQRPIGWRAQTDPAGSLVNMNSNAGALFETDVKLVLLCEVLGKAKQFECRLWVKVDAFRMKIIQLAG